MVVVSGKEVEGGHPPGESRVVLEAAVGWTVAIAGLLSHLDLPDAGGQLPIGGELELGSVRSQVANVHVN